MNRLIISKETRILSLYTQGKSASTAKEVDSNWIAKEMETNWIAKEMETDWIAQGNERKPALGQRRSCGPPLPSRVFASERLPWFSALLRFSGVITSLRWIRGVSVSTHGGGAYRVRFLKQSSVNWVSVRKNHKLSRGGNRRARLWWGRALR